ncbi:MAG: MATE family efflux transporter [Hyphomonas sp.]|uniref:MATE family efflux transporter n=1 Tax=Hyphomonas sp. TaxID=87 RepID=UPI00184D8462|nr:MATE family efflux transporter [Hyphomonas sp.]MBU3920994.1 MATE family efflux transporter [Alphaproteobacteria bacterium]MBA3070538.1 MATE family efflux transporter [Hyphomonas sp.]MBU4062068.1 MATE family efflux transporter [Alphaproteobacteria bacterium]MBU4165004.1 MATE family efflux transporter [Alphaproteobacteria bacterium]MBU4569140.1 MATE family efflux transporter [Alphaproteobacteria bacterium]
MLTRRKVLALALPVVAAQAATATTGLVDTLVMGRYGDKADLAAVAIAAVAFSFIYWAFGFLRMSTTGLTAQAGGRGDEDEKRAILVRALLLGGAIGTLLILTAPLLKLAMGSAFAGTDRVEGLAAGYFNARIWGAPAYLMGIAVTGWMLGTGKTGQMLIFQIVLNAINAGLDIWFVAGLNLGPAGIGAGTAIAEWAALGFGLWLVRAGLGARKGLFDRVRLAAMFSANRDIMIRTLALLLAFSWFVRSGTLISTAATAGNQVLLQFITVAAFVLDGFAFVAEKAAGEAWGAMDRAGLVRAMRLTSEFALLFGAAFSLAYFAGGAFVIDTFIRDSEARAAALTYLPYCAAVPMLGVAAWQLDGLFIGTTQGRALRNSGVIVAILYIGADLVLRPAFGNAGVWGAFLLMYVFRAAALGAWLPGLLKRMSPPQ